MHTSDIHRPAVRAGLSTSTFRSPGCRGLPPRRAFKVLQRLCLAYQPQGLARTDLSEKDAYSMSTSGGQAASSKRQETARNRLPRIGLLRERSASGPRSERRYLRVPVPGVHSLRHRPRHAPPSTSHSLRSNRPFVYDRSGIGVSEALSARSLGAHVRCEAAEIEDRENHHGGMAAPLSEEMYVQRIRVTAMTGACEIGMEYRAWQADQKVIP